MWCRWSRTASARNPCLSRRRHRMPRNLGLGPQASTTQDTPDKTVLRHRGKKAISGKRRRPAVANLHEPNYGATAKEWRQKQF